MIREVPGPAHISRITWSKPTVRRRYHRFRGVAHRIGAAVAAPQEYGRKAERYWSPSVLLVTVLMEAAFGIQHRGLIREALGS